MPQVAGWGMEGGLHSGSDPGQECKDRPSADLNKHQGSPYRVKYCLTRYQGGATTRGQKKNKRGGRGGLFPPALPSDDKTVVRLILGAEPPCLPTCISHKHFILINKSISCLSLCCRIPSALMHKEPEPL